MVKHIVIWRLKETAGGNTKSENAILIKNKLEGLIGKIPGLIKIEVGIDISNTSESGDVVLYSEFQSLESLHVYQDHPEHKAVMPFIFETRNERRLVDYVV